MYLMLDIVLNHTSHRHEWAEKAKQGEQVYQDYYYFSRTAPSRMRMTGICLKYFQEAAPGNFTWIPECGKWVMSVFHHYQWDLNSPQSTGAAGDGGSYFILCQSGR